jgi:hypothetical protein
MIKYNTFKLAIAALLLLYFAACGPSEPQKAVNKLNLAESLLAQGDTANALLHFDSIPKLYPKALVEGRKATQQSNRIYVSIMMEKRNLLDEAKTTIDTLIKSFTAEKGEFEKYTNYIYNRQTLDKSWSRSFLKVWVNELGELFLSSNYYGAEQLNHYAVRVYDKDVQAKTDSVPIGTVFNYQSDFNGLKWEKVTYRNGQADEVIKLIASKPELKLKAVFLGKRMYYIVLEDFDKKAIKEALELSGALKAKIKLEQEINYMQGMVKAEEE